MKLPWIPPINAPVTRLINQVILEEEVDDMGTNDYKKAISHYEFFI